MKEETAYLTGLISTVVWQGTHRMMESSICLLWQQFKGSKMMITGPGLTE